jgi:hypothetical protein
MKHKILWALGGVAAAVGVYELVFAPYHVPASFNGIAVSPGQMTVSHMGAAGKTPGNFAFILPHGAQWAILARTPAPGAAQIAIPMPSRTDGPLLVQELMAGQGVMFTWTDARGNAQASVYVFT